MVHPGHHLKSPCSLLAYFLPSCLGRELHEGQTAAVLFATIQSKPGTLPGT